MQTIPFSWLLLGLGCSYELGTCSKNFAMFQELQHNKNHLALDIGLTKVEYTGFFSTLDFMIQMTFN